MQDVPYSKVQQIVHLLSAVAGMNAPTAARREAIAGGVAALIGADIWVWIHSRLDPAARYPTGFAALDGGWKDDSERSAFLTGLHDDELNNATAKAFLCTEHQTLLLEEILPPTDSEIAPILRRWRNASGMGECILTVFPLDERTMSGIGFHRRLGKPAFSQADKSLVHLIFSAVGWLHAEGTDIRGNNDRLFQLSPRESEVLLYLLEGDSRKKIAARLKLSYYTVADHVKSIYKAFGVNSRAELHAMFLRQGGIPAARPAGLA